MFECLPERTRKTVALAYQEARALECGRVATDHLILGVIREGGHGARALQALGVTLALARERAVARRTPDEGPATAQVTLSPDFSRAIQGAMRKESAEAVSPERLLVEAALDPDSAASEVFRTFGRSEQSVQTALAAAGTQEQPSQVMQLAGHPYESASGIGRGKPTLDFETTTEILGGWAGREVIVVWWTPTFDFVQRPIGGRLRRASETADEAVFEVQPSPARADGSISFVVSRHRFVEANWTGGLRAGAGLSVLHGSNRTSIYLVDAAQNSPTGASP